MKRYGIVLFGLATVLAQPLAGQDYVKYTYNNPGQYILSTWASYYVGPAAGTLKAIGADPTSAAMSLYCVDFLNPPLPAQWVTADVSNIGSGNTSLTRLGASGLEAYKKAAFLSSLFDSYMTISQFTGLTQRQAWSGIQSAIWFFTTPSGTGLFTNDLFYGSFRDYANQHYLDYAGYGEWSVLTTTAVANNPSWDSQEIMVRNPLIAALSDVPPTGGDLPPTGGDLTPPGGDLTPTVTPEPQTYLLMGTGLVFLVLLGRRRMKEMGYV